MINRLIDIADTTKEPAQRLQCRTILKGATQTAAAFEKSPYYGASSLTRLAAQGDEKAVGVLNLEIEPKADPQYLGFRRVSDVVNKTADRVSAESRELAQPVLADAAIGEDG